MAKQTKKGVISFVGDKPMEITDDDVIIDVPVLTSEQEHTRNIVGKAVRAYRNAANDQLSSKYSHIKEFAPVYLSDPGNIVIMCCNDGVVIRHEKKSDSPTIISGWTTNTLAQVAAFQSQNLIQCHTTRKFQSTVETTGMEIKLCKLDEGGNQKQEIASLRIGIDVVIERPQHFPAPPMKPFCISSVQNLYTLNMECELISEENDSKNGQRFLTRNEFRLPVGWECIEIFPFTNLEAWNPEYAPVWAENDILAAVVTKKMRESHYQSLDPKAETRKQYAALLTEFKTLLDSNPEREELLQVFLKEQPYLLCPAHTKMWPKLALGAKETDFVFRDATSDYLLVELEKSTHPLFRKDGHPRQELTTAIGQITDWKRYLEDNLRYVQNELGLTDITTDPQSLVVIGRSHNLSTDNRRKLRAMGNATPKMKVLTYDDVYNNAKSVIENLFGPIEDPISETKIYYLT